MADYELAPLPVASDSSTEGAGKLKKRESKWKQNLNASRKDTAVITWKDLTYSVSIPKPAPPGETPKRRFPWQKVEKVDKVILNTISGYARPGQLLAIMGPSGAGKTTLMNLLAGRMQLVGKIEGELLFNGEKLDRRALKGISGYVLQDDLLHPHLTVRESLEYAALLKLPATMSKEEKLQRVDEVISELNLNACADTKIGNALVRGISGGERKRTSIGVELIKDPSVLFLDEPTTGLDSFTSLSIIETLKALARNNRTIITTIHQPNSSIFEHFDVFCLLARGEVTYFGPASESLAYFSSHGYPPPEESNPADYFLDLTADDLRSEENQKLSGERVEKLLALYKTTQYAEAARAPQKVGDVDRSNKFAFANWVNQFLILCTRAARNAFRDRMTYGLRLIQNIFLGVLIGLMYLRMGHGQTTVFNRLGLLFFVMVNQGFGAMFTALNVFPAEKKVVDRERLVGMYQVSSYFASKQVVELGLQIAFPVIIGSIVYWMTGLQPRADKFFIFLATLVVVALNAESMGMMISTLVPRTAIAMAIAPMIMVLFMIFSGFYINIDSIGPWFVWIAYISFIRWGFEALVINEMSGLKFTCKVGETNCWYNGEQVLDFLTWENGQIWYCILILIAEAIFMRIMTYVGLRLHKGQ